MVNRDETLTGNSETEPWLTRKSISILESMLRPFFIGIEWGSGGSTVWLAQRVLKLYSIEHEPSWHSTVKDRLNKHSIQNVSQVLIRKDSVSNPYYLGVNGSYRDYVIFVDTVPGVFDFALVDGRCRIKCVEHVKDRIKSGGMLVLDNSNRHRYRPIFEMLKDWSIIRTTNGKWDTTIFTKP